MRTAAVCVLTVPVGADVIVVSGGVWSTIVHVTVAGVASTFASASVARAAKVCVP